MSRTEFVSVSTLPSLPIKPKRVAVRAIVVDTSRGWSFMQALASWCGAEADRDEVDTEDNKYWHLILGRTRAYAGSVILKYSDGSFESLHAHEFNSTYVLNLTQGVFQCFNSSVDGKYHKRAGRRTEVAQCGAAGLSAESYTHKIEPGRVCTKCFGGE